MQFAKHIRKCGMVAAAVLASHLVCSCIDSNVPPPDVPGEILKFEVEGQLGLATINQARRTVEVALGEAVDAGNVRILRLEVTEGGSCDVTAGGAVDLSSPKKVIVKTVSGYEWTISATQNIEYRFAIEGQVGVSQFEMHSRSVFAYLPVGADMTRVKITQIKLWPEMEGVTVAPDVKAGDVVSFTASGGAQRLREIEVSYRDVKQTWRIYVTESNTVFETIDPFARKVHLSAFGQDEESCGFEYRPAGATEWTRVPDYMVTSGQDGYFSATLTGLSPETEYEVRAFSGESTSGAEGFATCGETPLPGGGFEEWHKGKDDRKKDDPGLRSVEAWNPWPEGGVWEETRWWDTGNKGVAFIDKTNGGNSLPDEGAGCPDNPDGTAAKLQTRWAMVKAAGGNIYFGEFGEMYGIDATCHLGHNWRDKPTKLKGWFKYLPQPVDEIVTDHYLQHPWGLSKEEWLGSPDSLHVCVALWADPAGRNIPFTVNTKLDSFVDFSRDKPGVIAYGAFASPQKQESWARFEIDIEYFETGELPPNTQLYLLVTASKSCNYYIAGTGRKTGGVGSLMYVDELKLVYD